ncbi:unnamed protein product [Agarophyton chilense]
MSTPPSFVASLYVPRRAHTRAAQISRCAAARRKLSRSVASRVHRVAIRSVLPVPLAPTTSDVWELDFYSRPVVGLDGKKLWELIITDSLASFEHVEAIPNSLVNSRELRNRVQAVIDSAPTKPTTIRFFRSQMFNMINIALSDIDVQLSPSRRTYALYQLLKYRQQNVYKNMPGFKQALLTNTSIFTSLDMNVPQPLPDALRCDSFAFGNLPLAQLQHFFAHADPDNYFGDACLADPQLPPDVLVPGMIIFSKRARALSAWLSGTELAFIRVVFEKQQILLECGLSTVYTFAQVTKDVKQDVRQFQQAKQKTSGIHFLAVQTDQKTDEIEGMWLLSELL